MKPNIRKQQQGFALHIPALVERVLPDVQKKPGAAGGRYRKSCVNELADWHAWTLPAKKNTRTQPNYRVPDGKILEKSRACAAPTINT